MGVPRGADETAVVRFASIVNLILLETSSVAPFDPTVNLSFTRQTLQIQRVQDFPRLALRALV